MRHHNGAGWPAWAAALVFLALVFVRLSAAAVPATDASADGSGAIGAEFVRIQVIANSDSPPDQQVKAHVRDAVRARLGEEVLGFGDAAGAMARVEELLPELVGEVAAVLAADGCDYGGAVLAGEFAFPPKSYGGLVIPAGEYPALRVALGRANGGNWWCVLFPPLCFVDIESSLVMFGEAGTGSGAVGDGGEEGLAADDLSNAETVRAIAGALEAAGQGGDPGAPGGAVRPQLRSWLWERVRGSKLWQWLFGEQARP